MDTYGTFVCNVCGGEFDLHYPLPFEYADSLICNACNSKFNPTLERPGITALEMYECQTEPSGEDRECVSCHTLTTYGRTHSNGFHCLHCIEMGGFKEQVGRDPIPGVDYDPDNCMCQDDYEYFTSSGRYAPKTV